MTENEARDFVREYLDGTLKKEELMLKFNVVKCECGRYELEEDMVYQKWDVGEIEDKVCETCQEDGSR